MPCSASGLCLGTSTAKCCAPTLITQLPRAMLLGSQPCRSLVSPVGSNRASEQRPTGRAGRARFPHGLPKKSSILGCAIGVGVRSRGKLRPASRAAASVGAVECQVEEEEDTLPHYFPRTIDVSEADDSISDDIVSGDSSADICELIGFDMGESLDRELGKPFNAEELKEAYANSGFFDAKPSKKPAAMWLIGPSACGKSTLAPQAAKWVGMESEGYVTVDGEAFRDAHGGYKKAILKGRQHGCVWWLGMSEVGFCIFLCVCEIPAPKIHKP